MMLIIYQIFVVLCILIQGCLMSLLPKLRERESFLLLSVMLACPASLFKEGFRTSRNDGE